MSNRNILLSCTVVSVQDSGFVYPSCEFCMSRLTRENPNRSRCPKCGSTRDIKDVDYRYRLSLKVLRDTNIFGVTVFGGCLNPFFGIDAGGLQRFVESERTEGRHSLQQVLAKAVEDCFIGKSFIFGFKLSGLDTESILHGECGSALPDVQFVAFQIISTHGAPLGLTVFSYMRKLMQASTESRCSSDPVNQSQQKDSLPSSFGHTLPLCTSLHGEPGSEGLKHPWDEISDLDLYVSPGQISQCSSLQPPPHGVESIATRYATRSDLNNETLSVLEDKYDTDIVQSTGSCSVKPYGSEDHVEIRRSTLYESSMTANLKLSPLSNHVSEMTGCNHRPTPTRACTAFHPDKPFYLDQNGFTSEDAPLSESLGWFLSHDVLSHRSDHDLCKRDQVLSARKKLITATFSRCTPVVGTSPSNEPMFTVLSDVTNAKRDKNVKNSQKQKYTKQKTLPKAHILAASTPSRTSSSKKHVSDKHLGFQNDQTRCNEPTNSKKDEESLLESLEDGFDCSSDLFQQSALDTTDLGVAETIISTTQQYKKDSVTKRRSSSFNFAPTLQSTPICDPSHNHAHKQRGKRSRSQCSRKQRTSVTDSRDLKYDLDITKITEEMRAELNQTAASAFENHESSAGGFEEEKKHLQEENVLLNEYSRDLFDQSF